MKALNTDQETEVPIEEGAIHVKGIEVHADTTEEIHLEEKEAQEDIDVTQENKEDATHVNEKEAKAPKESSETTRESDTAQRRRTLKRKRFIHTSRKRTSTGPEKMERFGMASSG